MTRVITTTICVFCSWATTEWLQPTIAAAIAIGVLWGIVAVAWWRLLHV